MLIGELLYADLDKTLNYTMSENIDPIAWASLCATYAFWVCNYSFSNNQSAGELSDIWQRMVDLDQLIAAREDASDFQRLETFLYPGFSIKSLGDFAYGRTHFLTDPATSSRAFLDNVIGSYEGAIETLEDFWDYDNPKDPSQPTGPLDILVAYELTQKAEDLVVRYRDHKGDND